MPAIRHILFPFDFSAQGSQVASFVRAYAEAFKARVTLFSVVPPTFEAIPAGLGPRIGDDPTEWKQALQLRLDSALIAELGDVVVARVVDAGDPAFRAVRFAEANAIDLIMMPTHGVGVFRSVFVGSVTSKVLHDAKCPVWTAAHAEAQCAGALPRIILCAVDGGPSTPALLKWAAGFSAASGATLKILHVVSPITDWPSLERERALQEQVRQEAHATIESMQREAGVKAPLRVAVGEIVPTVSEQAPQENADLIIIGRGSVSAPFGRLRTHAFGIIQRSPCPVLSV
jgi:nucleotide-binding universal stress UspA family protein